MTHVIDYHVRYAGDADLDRVLALRRHAETWLHAAGIDQWTVRSTGERNIRQQIADGTTFVVTTGAGDVIGSLALDAADLDFWTPTEANQPALYLYKFIISSERRGRGLGDALLNWACTRAAIAGARWLRLDCWKTNPGLHKYYLDRGFRQVDVRDTPGRQSGALFERPVDTILPVPDDDRFRLIDDTPPLAHPQRFASFDRYDPTGEAAIWQDAANVVNDMRRRPLPNESWNAALEAASRELETHARQIRQAQGMYYRVIDGRP